MGEKTIVLARHGQTDFNLRKEIQDPITPHLTEIGHTQAQTLKKHILSLGIDFDLIVCSDMTRTRETLKEIFDDYEQSTSIKIDPRLNERYHKDLVGKTKEDIEKDIGSPFTERMSWNLYFEGTDLSAIPAEKYPQDESLDAIRIRLHELLDEIKNHTNILLIGSSIINEYIIEYLRFGTIGVQKPTFIESDDGIDFQKNNELRILATDGALKLKTFKHIIFE